MSDQPRLHSGRYTFKHRPESDALDLGVTSSQPDTVDVLTADPGSVTSFLNHPDPNVRLDAARHPMADPREVAHLAHPDQPFHVRANLTHLPVPGLGKILADDPDPVVRARTLRYSFDLDRDTIARLERDPDVARASLLVS